MTDLPRYLFVPGSSDWEAVLASLEDRPISIGEGQTISAPHMVAILLEEAHIKPGDHVLEVGGGSGWLAALIGHVVGLGGRMTAVEYIESLAQLARHNIARQENLADRVRIVQGDASKGWPADAPFDVIIFSCAAPDVPQEALQQLKVHGRLLIPIGDRMSQHLMRFTRSDGGFHREALGPCAFVPLVGEAGF